MRTTLILIRTTAICLISAKAQAFPIAPVPLWPLTREASTIVVAKVEMVEEVAKQVELGASRVAKLSVIETLKGAASAKIEVSYNGNIICPAPPVYREGQKVVAFLDRADDLSFSTVAFSYGTLYPGGEVELEDMKAMVRLAISIQSAGLDPEKLEARKLDWALRAAALPGTRWHGLFELTPANEQVRPFYDGYGSLERLPVNPAGQAFLAKAFLATTDADTYLPMLLALLDGLANKEVDHAAIGWVEAHLALEDYPPWTDHLIRVTLVRFGDSKPVNRYIKMRRHWRPWQPEGLRQLWDQAKQDLGLPEVAARKVNLEKRLQVR